MHLPDMLWTTSWIRSKTLIINTPTKNSGDTGFRWCHEIPTKTHLPITPQRRSIKGELGNTKAEIQSLDPKLVSTFLCPYLHHENITSAAFEKCCNFYWPSGIQQGMHWATDWVVPKPNQDQQASNDVPPPVRFMALWVQVQTFLSLPSMSTALLL